MYLQSKVAVIGIIILICLTVVVAYNGEACARANIVDYLNQQYGAPNGFEPSGWNRNGTATWLDVQLTAGWKHMSVMGNLGIGNGSVATFGDVGSLPANQSDPYFMGADVSQQPIDPIRELNLNVVSPKVEETNTSAETDNSSSQRSNATVGRSTDSSSMPSFLQPPSLQTLQLPAEQGDNDTAVNETAASVTTSETPPDLTPENLTYSAYHPIMLGAPANDLLYEHPLATSVSMYCRLIGLEVPGSNPINIGMKCLGYGY